MQGLDNSSAFEISMADTARFRRIVIDVMTEACQIHAADESDYDGIGTLAEKQMHAAIKRFICPDESKHEILIDGSAGCIIKEEPTEEIDENASEEKTKKEKPKKFR